MAKYTDIDLSFSKNPVTNDVSILSDVASVKAAIKNLVLTDLGERPSDLILVRRFVVFCSNPFRQSPLVR